MSYNQAKNQINDAQCAQWHSLSTVNPLTQRHILVNGPTYNKLLGMCKHDDAKTNSESDDIDSKQNKQNKQNGPEQTCHLRRCPYVTYKMPGLNASPRRKLLLNAVSSLKQGESSRSWIGQLVCGKSKIMTQLREFYDRWNLCEAPISMDFNNLINNQLYIHLSEYLHVLYGDAVLPGMLYIDNHGRFESFSPWLQTLQSSFSGIIDNVKRLPGTMHVALTILTHEDGSDAHAMVLVFNKSQRRTVSTNQLNIEIIDPNMQSRRNYYAQKLGNFLRSHATTCGYTVKPYTIYKNLNKTFQGSDALMNMSSLDVSGYCGVWTLMMMELLAAGSRHSPMSAQEILSEAVQFKSASPAIWRKLALDYAFSRIIDLYALSSVFMYSRVHDLLDTYVTRYTDKISEKEVYDAISDYIPWFHDEVHDRLP